MNPRFILLFLLATLTLNAWAQIAPPSAQQVLEEATGLAAKEKKNVFIIFHASWCGWCHKMDTAMNDPAVKNFFEDNYVIRHLTVHESDKKKNEENPGALELLNKHGGEDQGIPFWLVFDPGGTLLADSQMRPDGADLNARGTNAGCPATKEEVAHFIKVLRATSPLKGNQLSVIEKRFLKNSE